MSPSTASDNPLLIRDVGLARVAAGPCERPPTDHHGLSINSGPPIWASCDQAGRARRHLRSAGGINFVPAGETSRWTLDAPLTMLKLTVPQSLVRAAAQDMDLDARTLDFQKAVQVRDAQIEHLGWTLHAEAQAGNPNGRLFGESLGMAFSIVLLRQFARASPLPPVRAGRFSPLEIKRITDYVESHLGEEDLSLRRLAAVAGTSVSHFNYLFRRTTGMPAHRFVMQRRVERAAVLLKLGHSSITQVAFETGFAHATHLARWTRRLLGTTPGRLGRHDR
jgi:AraC family transcriptional regulator